MRPRQARAGGVRGHVPEAVAFSELPPAIGALLRDLEKRHSCDLVHGLAFTRVFSNEVAIGGVVRGRSGKAYLLDRAVDQKLAGTLRKLGFVVGTQRSGTAGQRHWYEIGFDRVEAIREGFALAAAR